MANEWLLGREIRFYSAWVGSFICVLLLFPLTEQLKYRVTEYKEYRRDLSKTHNQKRQHTQQHQDDVDVEESTTTGTTMSCNNEHSSSSNAKKQKKKMDDALLPPLLLLMYAFLCVVFAIIHLVLVGIFMSEPQRLGITALSDASCACIYWILYMSYNFSFYFFTVFMLYRIKIVFTEPLSVRLHSASYAVFLGLINLQLVFKIVFGLQSTYIWNAEYAICSYLIDMNVLVYFFYIKYLWDSLLVFLLSFMFIRRLCVLTRQNPKVNALITRTIVCGLIATITSLLISVCKLGGIATEYFVNLDEVINCFCVVFSYKVTACHSPQWQIWRGYLYRRVGGNHHDNCNTAKQPKHVQTMDARIDEAGSATIHDSNKRERHDEDGERRIMKSQQQKEVYVQPPDDVVMEELFGADDNYEQDDLFAAQDEDEEGLHLHGHYDPHRGGDTNASIMHGHDENNK